MKYKNIYVAATSQHVGKTTCTLGLVAAFMQSNFKVGYCKPVGQKSLNVNDMQVDKDAVLFSDLMQFDLTSEIHSPVILGKGATAALLDHPERFDFPTKIHHAAKVLSEDYELVIYEGTGHPGVGSIADLSNADVAKMLNAGVIMVVEGGIGSTIDMLSLCLAKFQLAEVPILGVIVNKVMPDNLEKVHYYLSKALAKMGLPLLGLLPYDKSLAFPLISTVAEAINGHIELNANKQYNRVADIIAGSLINLDDVKYEKDLLLVVSADRVDVTLEKFQAVSEQIGLEGSPLSGIVATGKGDIVGACKEYILKHQIPVIRTNLDTYGSVLKISRIEVKINLSTPWKVARAIELIEHNVDMSKLISQL